MSVEIQVTCLDATRCEALHVPSGATLRTTAPRDNGGDGSSFSPTDLVATALATCVMTIMAMAARKYNVDLSGATARVVKHMSSTPPRRIVELPMVIDIPVKVDPAIQSRLEDAARHCPVHTTLGGQVDAVLTFNWAPWP